ncbi:unnamed protein product [Brachionus calyciflorus]|uniref:Chorion peroxidase n=1 Tax=Brachionus calyciflorus TaxID=104777 RepID=A0A813TTK0_9BILA|nr:unnamed protein product [Brachionus calyciflorus]
MKIFLILCSLGIAFAHNHEQAVSFAPQESLARLSLRQQRPPQQQSVQNQKINQIQQRLSPLVPPQTPQLQSQSAPSTQLGKSSQVPIFCPFNKPIACDLSFPYRTFDGTCNNLKNTWWGKADTPYKRIVRPAYADGLSEPRVARDGSELPNARELSCGLHAEKYEIEPFVNHIFMQWGQWLNHDITSLSVSREEEKDLGICSKCQRTSKCLPVQILSNFTCNCVQQMSHQCIEFTRSSASFPDMQCSSQERAQINMQTAYIDASSVYGVTREENEKLRDKLSGRGRMLVSGGNLLPKDMQKKPSDCLDFTQEKRCFKAGDDRVNQNTALMTFHTLLIREHNRIADILSKLNPTWEDETVFQETRRIIIAEIQQISYNEYVPILLGHKVASAMNLVPGNPFRYNPDVDPRVANEYAASYGRFGHSMIRGKYSRVDNKFDTAGHMPMMLRHAYFKANPIYETEQGGLESIVRGLIKDPLMKIDRWFTDEISKHLFETHDSLGRPFHFDLVSINIQRGRDHGVPGYTVFRDFCKLQPIRTWEDLGLFVQPDVVSIFREKYKFVEDVDLFSAIVSEFKPEGSMVGPTLNCLLGLQLSDLKFGDRFWFETNESPAAFTPAQLAELRKVSLAKLLCRNLADTPQISPKVMLSMKLEGNDLKNCSELEDINWSFWKA